MTFVSLAALLSSRASAQGKSVFCGGFEQGWKTLKGDNSIVPICPIEPITPIGSNSFREGLKAGLAAARQTSQRGVAGGIPSEDGRTFCDGWNEGWKTVKGDIAIIPICPIPPITPIGSSPYREGLKAGMARAQR